MDHSEVKHLPKVDHTPAELAGWQRVMLKASDIIDERGLCKESYSGSRGYCIYGALYAAADLTPMDAMNEALNEARRILLNKLPDTIICWNDHKDRTKDEVVAKLRAVALGL
jgi:hypothetical protein